MSELPEPSSPRPSRRRRIGHAAEIVAIAVVISSLIWLGLFVRRESWERSRSIRYMPDMQNAWDWGSRATREGYVGLYDKVIAEGAASGTKELGLDYMPLRLGVMTLWAKSRLAANPSTNWRAAYDFNAPLLHLNAIVEAMAALAVFALVSLWSRRNDWRRAISRRWLRAEWIALIGFTLAWFNPASIVSAHVRPTWDVWILPFYLWAIFFACVDGWLIAGAIIGVGVMAKGQLLIVTPIFLLWPMMRFRVLATARFVAGFAGSVAAIAGPWLIGPHAGAIALVAAVTLMPFAAYLALKRWPIAERSLPARALLWLTPLAFAAAAAACVPMFQGTLSPFKIGLVYGADKFRGMQVGGASSIAGVLQMNYGLRVDTAVPLPGGGEVTLANFLIALFAIGLLASAWAMRTFEKRGDVRFLIAMATPWILYFAFFPRMHERYLLWGAVCACTAVGVGVGPTLLAILFSLMSTMMSFYQLLIFNRGRDFLTELGPNAGRTLYRIVGPSFPGMGWAVVLASLVWLWLIISPVFERNSRCRML